MSNVASVLREEISRISRKEIKRETSALKKSSTTHRLEIAALKRRVQELERQLRQVSRGGERSVPAAANEESVSPGTRFSAKSMASQRRRGNDEDVADFLMLGAKFSPVSDLFLPTVKHGMGQGVLWRRLGPENEVWRSHINGVPIDWQSLTRNVN